jgi:hypothetical protein
VAVKEIEHRPADPVCLVTDATEAARILGSVSLEFHRRKACPNASEFRRELYGSSCHHGVNLKKTIRG